MGLTLRSTGGNPRALRTPSSGCIVCQCSLRSGRRMLSTFHRQLSRTCRSILPILWWIWRTLTTRTSATSKVLMRRGRGMAGYVGTRTPIQPADNDVPDAMARQFATPEVSTGASRRVSRRDFLESSLPQLVESELVSARGLGAAGWSGPRSASSTAVIPVAVKEPLPLSRVLTSPLRGSLSVWGFLSLYARVGGPSGRCPSRRCTEGRGAARVGTPRRFKQGCRGWRDGRWWPR